MMRNRWIRRQIEALRPRLYRSAYAWTHNRHVAEDIVHDTFVKALRGADGLRDDKALEAWLFRIMTNCWRDQLRRATPTDELIDSDLIDERGPESRTAEQQLVRTVRRAVANLPDGYRQALILVDLEGFSYVETASILDIPVGTVMSRLSRARDRLRRMLAGWDADTTKKISALRSVK